MVRTGSQGCEPGELSQAAPPCGAQVPLGGQLALGAEPVHPHQHWVRSWTYPSTPSAVPRCRRSVVAALRARGLRDEPLDSVALVVSELAGNAVEHAAGGQSASQADTPADDSTGHTTAGQGGAPVQGRQGREFTVHLRQCGRWLRIEVRDGGTLFPERQRPTVPEVTATAGRGLFLVEALSFRWGVRSAARGKSVWCELAC